MSNAIGDAIKRLNEFGEGRVVKVGDVVAMLEVLRDRDAGGGAGGGDAGEAGDGVAGQVCPECGCGDTRVFDSRKWRELGGVALPLWRARRCMDCGERWETVEVMK